MNKLIRGAQRFAVQNYPHRSTLLAQLAQGQTPEALVFTCADSRVCPTTLTQAPLGTLLVQRNAGNIVPPYGAPEEAEGATLELALTLLNIRHIIVLGHTSCAAVASVLGPQPQAGATTPMPTLSQWLRHAHDISGMVDTGGALAGHEDDVARQRRGSEANVLLQMQHLMTYPLVQERLAAGTLTLHGWLFVIHEGQVYGYASAQRQFIPLGSVPTAMP